MKHKNILWWYNTHIFKWLLWSWTYVCKNRIIKPLCESLYAWVRNVCYQALHGVSSGLPKILTYLIYNIDLGKLSLYWHSAGFIYVNDNIMIVGLSISMHTYIVANYYKEIFVVTSMYKSLCCTVAAACNFVSTKTTCMGNFCQAISCLDWIGSSLAFEELHENI